MGAPCLEFIKKKDPFMLLKTGAWDPMLDLFMGQQALKAVGVPYVSKQKTQCRKGKEATSAKSMGKETAPSQAKPKRKMVESQAEGAPKKKPFASAIQAATMVQV